MAPRTSFVLISHFLCCFLLAGTRTSDAGAGAPQLQVGAADAPQLQVDNAAGAPPQPQIDAAGAPQLQAIDCSTAGNYTVTDAYAANLNQLLAALPTNTVSKNGGFFNATVGEGAAAVYGLAMCSVDFSRSDCNDCLVAASSSASGLLKRCPGSVTVSAIFDQCMLRYSNRNFFATAETDIIFTRTGASIASKIPYSNDLKQGLAYLSAQAASSPERFAASSTAPYALVQCTWNLPSDKCKACIDTLSANASNLFEVGVDGERKSYSCRVRYSNSSFTVVPLVAQTDQTTGPPTPTPSSPSSVNSPSSTAKSSSKAVVGGAVAGTAVAVGLLVCIVMKYRRSRDGCKPVPEGSTVRRFSYEQLALATDNFAERRKLGSGSFGDVYKCHHLADLGPVAVKRIFRVTERALSDYSKEIDTLSRLKHTNIMRLMGSCNEDGKLLLVYELMENRSLEDHLHRSNASADGTPRILNWARRYKIALGIAEALLYLHENSVVHRDIKPSNVLLDDEFKAKVGDFGLVTQVDRDRTSQSMSISGCINYMDPEYESTGRAGPASDVYSFGLVLLEMASGKKPTSPSSKTTNQSPISSLAVKVRAALRGNNQIADVVDSRLNGRFNMEQMKLVLRVGLLCAQFDHRSRPTSEQVLNYLRGEVPVPDEFHPNTPTVTIMHDTRVRAYVPKAFTYAQLSEATGGFSELLGKGSYGEVYRGELRDDFGDPLFVAVKKSKLINKDTTQDYLTEIEVITQLRHPNLLRLMGWCGDSGELIVVYELMENGCLGDHLSSRNDTHAIQPKLDWAKRYNIIRGIASALHYLHECPIQKRCVLHRDVKPSNVMLDESFEAKLGDFGLIRQVDTNVPTQTLTVGGTLAYLDPEYYRTKKASRESDVYSFGVVVLQMVLGEKPSWTIEQGSKLTNHLVENARGLYDANKILDAVDKQLKREFDKKQMERVILVGLLCVQADRTKRPRSSQVMHYLTELETQLPISSVGVTEGANATTGSNSSIPAHSNSSTASTSRQKSDHYGTCREIL